MADAICIDRIGQPLLDYIADKREAGESWEDIAVLLSDETDGIVQVSWMTIRRWAA